MGIDLIKLNTKAENYLDGFPIGNSHLGLMVKGETKKEILYLNDSTFYITKKRRNYFQNYYKTRENIASSLLDENFDKARKEERNLLPKKVDDSYYVSAGMLEIEYNHTNITNYERVLNLSEGFVKVSYDTNNIHIERRYLASISKDLIGINIKASEPISITCSLNSLGDLKSLKIDNDRQIMHIKTDNVSLYSNIIVRSGNVIVKDNKFILSGMNIIIFYSSTTTNITKFPKSYLNNLYKIDISNLTFNTFFKETVSTYKKLYSKQSFTTDFDLVNNYYHMSRYLLIASSLGSMPMTDISLWSKEVKSLTIPYKIDFNFNLMYSFALEANLDETIKTALKFTYKLYKKGRITALKLYHSSSSCAHSNTNMKFDTSPLGYEVEDGVWPLGEVRLANLIYKYYFYTLDLKFLKKNFKVLSSCANFLLSILKKDKQGKYVVIPSVNPRTRYNVKEDGKDISLSVSNGTCYDDIVIYEFFFNYIIARRALGFTEEDNNQYLDILFNLYHIQIQNDKIVPYHGNFEVTDLSKSLLTELSLLASRHIMEAKVFKSASINTIKSSQEVESNSALRDAYALSLYTRLGSKTDAYDLLVDYNKKHTTESYLTLNEINLDAIMTISKSIRDMFIIDTLDKITLLPCLIDNITTYTLKGFPIYHDMSVDLYKNKNSFLLYVDSKKIKDLEINYKSRQYFVKIKEGKNKIDLNQLFNIKK